MRRRNGHFVSHVALQSVEGLAIARQHQYREQSGDFLIEEEQSGFVSEMKGWHGD